MKNFIPDSTQFWQLFNAEAESLAGKSNDEVEARIYELQELEYKIKCYKQAALVVHRDKLTDVRAEVELRQKLHDMEYKVQPLPAEPAKARKKLEGQLTAIEQAIKSFAKINPNAEVIYNTLKNVHPTITLAKVNAVLTQSDE